MRTKLTAPTALGLAAWFLLSLSVSAVQQPPHIVGTKDERDALTCNESRENWLFDITDATGGSTCASPTGGSSTYLQCVCRSGAWAVVGSGSGGSDSFTTIDVPTGTDPIADSPADTLTYTCAPPLTCDGDDTTDTVELSIDDDYSPDRYPGSATLDTASSDEFTGGIETGTWRDGNSPALTLELDAAKLSTSASEDQLRVRWATPPSSGDYVITVKLALSGYTNLSIGGLVTLETGTEATPTKIGLLTVQRGTGSGGAAEVGVFTKTSYTSAYTSIVTAFNLSTAANLGLPVCLQERYARSTKVMTYLVAMDCATWLNLGTRTHSNDPISVGYGFDSHLSTGTTERQLRFYWMRTRTDATGTTPPYPAGATP